MITCKCNMYSVLCCFIVVSESGCYSAIFVSPELESDDVNFGRKCLFLLFDSLESSINVETISFLCHSVLAKQKTKSKKL